MPCNSESGWRIYLELAVVDGSLGRSPFMRLCGDVEERFPDIQGWQLRLVPALRNVAVSDVNCFFMFEDTWLRTTISLQDPRYGDAGSRENLQQIEGQMIKFRRNIIPGTEYLTRLQDEGFAHRRSHRARDFYTLQFLEEPRGERRSLMSKLKERRRQGIQCDLEMSLLRARESTPANPNPSLIMELRSVDIAREVVKLRTLGEGSDGTVWEVLWGNRTYAMKTFHKGGLMTAIREHAVARLRNVLHPHIVHAFGRSLSFPTPEDIDPALGRPLSSAAAESDDSESLNSELVYNSEEEPSLLMELLDGDLFRLVIEGERAQTIQLSKVERLDVLLQIASAMRNLHQNNVVHGDLKLGNILFSEFEVSGSSRYYLVKVADFGSAKEIDPNASHFKPNGSGTDPYAAPELVRCRKNNVDTVVDEMVDVYSFGVVACEILTAQKADKKCLQALWKNLEHSFQYPDEVIQLVGSCLESDPVKRPTSSLICDQLTNFKLNLQGLERRVAAYQKLFFFFPAIAVLLIIFLHCFLGMNYKCAFEVNLCNKDAKFM